MTKKKETTPVVKQKNDENSQSGNSTKKESTPNKNTSVEAHITDKTEDEKSNLEESKIPEHVAQQSNNPVENLISFITTDQNLLKEANDVIEKAKEQKKEIADRLKDLRRDVATLYKYATPEQKSVLDELGFDMDEPGHGLNSVAQTALDILAKSKKQLTNEELYNEYVASLPVGEEPVNYTQFNIKLRSPINTQLIVKREVDDGQGSRTDIIVLNGGMKYN